MLYTFANSQYDQQQLITLFTNITSQDAILLWQNGVLLPIKYPQILQLQPHYYLLKHDVIARGLQAFFPQESRQFTLLELPELVQLTESHYPQLSM